MLHATPRRRRLLPRKAAVEQTAQPLPLRAVELPLLHLRAAPVSRLYGQRHAAPWPLSAALAGARPRRSPMMMSFPPLAGRPP